MKRLELSLLAGIVCSMILGSFAGFGAQCAEVREDVVRLHILANSDSPKDQENKYAVRDALLEQAPNLFADAESRGDAERTLLDNLPEIEEIARQTLSAGGSGDSVKAELVNMYFSTREYETTTLAAGRYDAVRITIGHGAGQNWWCVMFPPMCIPAASETRDPVGDSIEALSGQPLYKPKFAIVELVEQLKNRWGDSQDVPILEENLAETEDESGEDDLPEK